MNQFRTKLGRIFLGSIISSALAACGGGYEVQTLNISEFVAMAKAAKCTETRNRLYLVDDQFVLWDAAGSCAYVSPAYKLFGKTPSDLLCTYTMQPVGAFTVCSTNLHRDMFNTITVNLDKADFGLGSTHRVQQIPF